MGRNFKKPTKDIVDCDVYINIRKLVEFKRLENITNSELAISIDVHASTLSKLESGKFKTLGSHTLYKLARYFNTTMEDLLIVVDRIPSNRAQKEQ